MEETAPETPSAPTPNTSETPEVKPGVDKLLVGLCAALWIGALVVLFVQAPGMRVNWQLGNLKQGLDNGEVDKEVVKKLVELAESTDVVGMLRSELEEGAQFDPYREDKILYRIALLEVLQHVPGKEAFEAVKIAGSDPDPRVRRFSFLALTSRVRSELSDRREAAVAIMEKANVEIDLMTRVVAIQQVGELDALPAELKTRLLGAWPFINGLRTARDGSAKTSPVNHMIRSASFAGLEALVGDLAELTYEAGADLETRDAQQLAIESWFVSEGGSPPEGVLDYDAWKTSLSEPEQQAPDGGSGE